MADYDCVIIKFVSRRCYLPITRVAQWFVVCVVCVQNIVADHRALLKITFGPKCFQESLFVSHLLGEQQQIDK